MRLTCTGAKRSSGVMYASGGRVVVCAVNPSIVREEFRCMPNITVSPRSRSRGGSPFTGRTDNRVTVPRVSVKKIPCPSADHPRRRAPPEGGKRSNVSASLRGGPPDTDTTKTSAVPAQVGGSSLATYAIQRPSGEYRGAPSAAPVRATGLISPVATSTVAISDSGQSFTRGVGTCVKTIVRPSGDQSNQPGTRSLPTLNSPLVSRRAGCFPLASFSTGITHNRCILKRSSTTFASFLPFWAFASSAVSASGIMNAICWLSGDHLKLLTFVFTSVTWRASPPSTRSSQRLFLPDRSDANAIQRPSGDHCGLVQDLSP